MKSTEGLPNPFNVVAKALGCSSSSLSMDSAIYKDHGWDSFGHVSVIMELENAYGISIDDEVIEKYVTMRAIQQLYEQILQGGDLSDG